VFKCKQRATKVYKLNGGKQSHLESDDYRAVAHLWAKSRSQGLLNGDFTHHTALVTRLTQASDYHFGVLSTTSSWLS
jgi:hypothetical protein